MNYFLILIILCLGGGGYYEYTTMQQQLSDQDTQIQKLQSDNADLKRKLEAAATAPATTNAAASAEPAAPGATPASSGTPAPGWSNVLGTITTADGKTYQNCHLMKVKPAAIVVQTSDGMITEIGYLVMPAPLQQKFGYDPKAGANLPDDVVQADEGLRQASKD